MSIRVTCPHCGRQAQLAAETAAKTARCECGVVVAVPAAARTSYRRPAESDRRVLRCSLVGVSAVAIALPVTAATLSHYDSAAMVAGILSGLCLYGILAEELAALRFALPALALWVVTYRLHSRLDYELSSPWAAMAALAALVLAALACWVEGLVPEEPFTDPATAARVGPLIGVILLLTGLLTIPCSWLRSMDPRFFYRGYEGGERAWLARPLDLSSRSCRAVVLAPPTLFADIDPRFAKFEPAAVAEARLPWEVGLVIRLRHRRRYVSTRYSMSGFPPGDEVGATIHVVEFTLAEPATGAHLWSDKVEGQFNWPNYVPEQTKALEGAMPTTAAINAAISSGLVRATRRTANGR